MKNKISLAGTLLLLTCACGWAQDETNGAETKSRKWKTKWELAGDVGHNSNVFKLSPSGKSKLELNSPAYKTSGRFKDMESVDDYIISPSLGVKTGNKKDLLLGLGADYNKYLQNPKLSYLRLDFSAGKRLSKRSNAVFKSDLLPDRFQRNYLADATDLTGHVSPAERIYKAASYTQWLNSLAYKYRFIKQKKGRAGVAGSLLAGYGTRKYNDPFKGRDRNVLRAEAAAHFALTKDWNVKLAYDHRSVDSPVKREVLILDEALFNLDLNNNGFATDTNIRTVQPVDRSFKSGTWALSTRFSASKAVDFAASYKSMSRDYSSSQALDPDHKDRVDKRRTFRGEMDYLIRKGLHFTAAYEHVRQDTNKKGDPASTGEVLDYSVDKVTVGLAYRF